MQDGAGTADEDTVDGCERQLRAWLALPPTERARMGEKARLCFERRYTAKRAAVSMLTNVYHAIHAKRLAAARRGA